MKLAGPTDKPRGLVRTHLWLVLLATCMAMAAAAAAAAAKPVSYTATAEVVVSPQKTDSATLQPDMGTERAIALSGVVVRRGASALELDQATVRSSLSVSVLPQTRVLHISYTASTAEAAFEGGSILATAYVDYRDSQGTDEVATLVTPPSVPTSGSRGSLPLYLLLGLVAGLSVGVSAAWLWDRLSDRVRSTAELRETTGLPILTRVPRWDSVSSPLAPEGRARESFAFVAARVASMTGHTGTTIVVTSPRRHAGTTTVACGTAAALAEQGKRVVLIAANPAGLRPEQVLGATTTPGLSQLVARGCSPELALHPTEVPNLSVVPMGGSSRTSLGPEDLHLVLERLERRSYVVIDAPPLLTSADALLLADLSHLVVLVGDLRSGSRTDVREGLALLDDVAPRLAGWVVNVPPRRRRARPVDADRTDPLPESADPEPDEQEPAEQVDGSEPDSGSATPPWDGKAARKGRQRPDMKLPGVPTTGTAPRDGVLPLRTPASAARRP